MQIPYRLCSNILIFIGGPEAKKAKLATITDTEEKVEKAPGRF
jgi:hypothetical protein